MKLRDTFISATQNLGRRKVRTVLTSVGVFVGILTIVTMVSLGIGIQQQVTGIIRDFGLDTVFVSPKRASLPAGVQDPLSQPSVQTAISPQAVERLRQIKGVASIEVMLSLPTPPEMSLTVGGKSFPIAFSDLSGQARVFSSKQTILAGKALSYSEDARGILLGQRGLKRAGYQTSDYAGLVGKAVTITVVAPRGDRTTFQTTIVGVSDVVMGSGDSPTAELGNADKADVKKWWYNNPKVLETEGYSSAVVHTDTLNDATLVAAAVEKMGFQTSTLQTLLDQVNRIFTILQVMLSSIGLLALLVASIGIVNTMIMAIYERTREIGILKALGSSNGDVLKMFMVEAGLIGLFGGIVGVLSGWGLGLVLNRVIQDYLNRERVPITAQFFVITWDLVLEALVFSTLVGIVAGLYPAFRAARLDPLAALRHE